ncbi:hypothetical protein R3P38DRAFT_2814564 [Favolaschia claudopus]|uniref:Uncharacterized protein n=1 Tax=Favolaschia claudopus TaxID=2862362 RepID=A0AAV9Z3K8_9AGAR
MHEARGLTLSKRCCGQLTQKLVCAGYLGRVDCQIPCPHYSEIFKGQMGWLGLELKRLNRATRVDYDRLKRTTSGTQVLGRVEHIRRFGWSDKYTASIEYVSLIVLQNHASQVSGVLARFRDIDFNGYRHCVSPNTPIEGVRNPARQYQSRDVKVGDNPTAQTLSFGKEIEEHTIQQGSVRVNNGMQQNVGELATQTSPLS